MVINVENSDTSEDKPITSLKRRQKTCFDVHVSRQKGTNLFQTMQSNQYYCYSLHK